MPSYGTRRPLAPRAHHFWKRVEFTESCWIWRGPITHNGYGFFSFGTGGRGNSKRVGAHRFAYDNLVGPIPEGLTLDHLCRNPPCVNPSHLEPVPIGENVHRSPIAPAAINARKTHCKNGHPFDLLNTYIFPDGRRSCRTCQRQHDRRHKQRKKAGPRTNTPRRTAP